MDCNRKQNEPARGDRQTRWEGRIPAAIFDQLDSINGTAAKTLFVLLRHANEEGYCWPSIATIATAAFRPKAPAEPDKTDTAAHEAWQLEYARWHDRHERKIRRALRSLKALGIVVSEPFPAGPRQGKWRANRYYLPACDRRAERVTKLSPSGEERVTETSENADKFVTPGMTQSSPEGGQNRHTEQSQLTPQRNSPREIAEPTLDSNSEQSVSTQAARKAQANELPQQIVMPGTAAPGSATAWNSYHATCHELENARRDGEFMFHDDTPQRLAVLVGAGLIRPSLIGTAIRRTKDSQEPTHTRASGRVITTLQELVDEGPQPFGLKIALARVVLPAESVPTDAPELLEAGAAA